MPTTNAIQEIESRKAKAEAEVARLRGRLADAERECEKFSIALEVFASVFGNAKPNEACTLDGKAYAGKAPIVPAAQPKYRDGSIAADMLIVLRASGQTWWTANELQYPLSQHRGEKVKMTSVSPNLSRLKVDGHIIREEMKFALTERAVSPNEKEAPDEVNRAGQPSEASGLFTLAKGREAGPGGGP